MEVEKCVICLETFDDVSSKKKTVCEHEFHDECLEKWVKQDGTCPICRNVLQKQRWLLKKLRRYFFMGVLFFCHIDKGMFANSGVWIYIGVVIFFISLFFCIKCSRRCWLYGGQSKFIGFLFGE